MLFTLIHVFHRSRKYMVKGVPTFFHLGQAILFDSLFLARASLDGAVAKGQQNGCPSHWCSTSKAFKIQGCSLGLKRLGLEAVSRRFLKRLVSSPLGLEDITSRSRSRDFSLVNNHAMHQACGYIMKKIMDLNRK